MKTTKLLAMSMALCLGATSAFGQNVKKHEASGSDVCTSAYDLTSYIGTDADGKVTCIIGDNENAGANVFHPDTLDDCWASDPNQDVWYKFTVATAGTWTISSDNGINVFDTDVQLALWDDCNGGNANLVACNDDAGDCNVLAAGFTVDLVANEPYYLQVDIFGADNTGKFALTIDRNLEQPVANDCSLDAYSIEDAYTALDDCFSATGWFWYNRYSYGNENHDTLEDPTYKQVVTGFESECTSPLFEEKHDVWFKFQYDDSKPALLSLYPKNGCNLYGMQIFVKKADADSCNGALGNNKLQYIDCSLGDGFNSHGTPEGDWARGDFFDHPRINLKDAHYTVGGNPIVIKDEDSVYVRVYQYPRVLVGDPEDSLADPSQGLIKFVFETIANDGDVSCDANETILLTCRTENGEECDDLHAFGTLCNAGQRGGISAVEGGTANPTGRINEPATFDYNGATTAKFGDGNCEVEDESTIITSYSTFNNNSGYYRFEVCDTYDDSIDIGALDTLFALTLYNPDGTFEDTVLFASILTCQGISAGGLEPAVPTAVILPLLPFGLGGCCPEISCEPVTEFCFKDLKYCGVNGAEAEFFILPADTNCTDSIALGIALAGVSPQSACDECLCFRPTQPLTPGQYDLVVDGENGSLVSFDLEVTTTWVIPGTNICCEDCAGGILPPFPSLQSKAPATNQLGLAQEGVSAFDLGIRPNFMAPMPAEGYMDLGYSSPIDGTVSYDIVDLNGKTMDAGSFTAVAGENTHRFDVENLATGMYIINMRINGMETKLRMMKQ